MDTLLFATNNKNKAREVEEALKKINFPIEYLDKAIEFIKSI